MLCILYCKLVLPFSLVYISVIVHGHLKEFFSVALYDLFQAKPEHFSGACQFFFVVYTIGLQKTWDTFDCLKEDSYALHTVVVVKLC